MDRHTNQGEKHNRLAGPFTAVTGCCNFCCCVLRHDWGRPSI